MKNIWIATNNEGKAEEFRDMFAELGYTIKTLNDLKEPIDIEETGSTFEENARIKSETLLAIVREPVLADDSGLVIDPLDGEPGVYSARYAGDHDSEANITKVLRKLEDVPEEKRTARFVCVLAVSRLNEETLFFRGTCEGKITFKPQGDQGFGYDPIFLLPDRGVTLAQLSKKDKSAISHRGHAIQELKKDIPVLFEASSL